MREILFRGKRINTNEWVYGGIVKTFHPNFESEDAVSFFLRKQNCYAICENYKDIFVEQDTIGQYTGLTDKNGKKIFEGDILKYKSNPPCKVSYINCQFVMMWRYVYRDFSDVYDYDIEVIGNIYDNPELLKESEQK